MAAIAKEEKKKLATLSKKETADKKADLKKKAAKAKKKRRSPIQFIKETIAELKKVTWPTKKEFWVAVLTVIVFILAFAIVIGGIDLGLSQLFNLIVGN